MKKLLLISILIFGCSSETLPGQQADVSTDASVEEDVREDTTVVSDTGRDAQKDVLADILPDQSQDVRVDVIEDVEPDLEVRIPRGTCESDADCVDSTCVTIGEDLTGWKICAKRFPERTTCDEVGFDECCKSEDCTNGANGVCLSPLPICTGIRPPTHNRCYYDECARDSDCTQSELGVCIPGGAFGEGAASCSYGGCRVDADCTEGEEGACIPFTEPCANRHGGFHCVYKDSECRSDDDCKNGLLEYCSPKDGGTCEPFRPPA